MDGVIVVLVLIFAIRGWVRGVLAQAFSLLGLLAGLWIAGWVSQWVGEHWQLARPAAVFWLLRGLVAVCAGLAVLTLFQFLGSRAREAAREGPAGWLDGPGGLALGAAKGTLTAAILLMLMLLVPWPHAIAGTSAHARLAAPLMHRAADVCDRGGRFVPGGAWLRDRFLSAERRAQSLARNS